MKNYLIALFVLFSCSAFAQTGYKVGDIATDFKLKNIDGKNVSLSDYKDAKGFIVVFTCNTCPYAIAYQDRVKELDKIYSPKGYKLIAINPNDPEVQPGDAYDKMQERAKEKDFKFPYLVDQDQSVTQKYGATRTPHTFILKKTAEGNVVEYIGAIDNDTEGNATEKYAEIALNQLLDGKKPTVTFTKAVGCGIKSKSASK